MTEEAFPNHDFRYAINLYKTLYANLDRDKMTYTLIIAEKPDAAMRLALALAESKLNKKTSKYGVDYYEFYRGKRKFLVAPAVGHLFNLKQKGKGWGYPIFDVEWVPSFRAVKKSAFSEKYFRTMEEVAKNASGFIIACDMDIEGSTLGYNILRFICKKNDAKRMKFSTLTKPDLVKSYEEIMPHLDWQNIESGEVRHILDFYYGINTSRALTSSIKKAASRFALLTTGRVQGPILSILAEREAEIKKFIPTPYWQIQAKLLIDKQEIIAEYEKEKLWEKGEAEKIRKESDSSKAIVEDVAKKQYRQSPPSPFNVTSLQTEAYRFFGYSPQQTMQIAQRLYTAAYLSYPRTSVDWKDTLYIIDSSGLTQRVKIGEFIDSMMRESDQIISDGDSEELEVHGIKTFSVNAESNKVEIKDIKKLIRHPIEEDLYEIATREGKKVRATKSHSLFTFKNGKIVSIPTKELEIGDFIVAIKNMDSDYGVEDINLLERAVKLNMIKEISITHIKGTSIYDLTYKMKNGNDYRFRDAIPLDVLLEHINYKDILNLPLKIRARAGKNKFEMPIKQKMTPELARLLGYFDSEGCKWMKGGCKATYEVCLAQENEDVLKDMVYCVNSVFDINLSPVRYRNNTNKIRLYGKSFFNIFRLLGCDGNHLTKSTSDLILSGSRITVAKYLKAFFAGDGYVHLSGEGMCYVTTSENLADSISFLLSRRGIQSRILEVEPVERRRMKSKVFIIGIYGRSNTGRFSEEIGFVKDFHKNQAARLSPKVNESSTTFESVPKELIDWSSFIAGVSDVGKRYTGVYHTKTITLAQVSRIKEHKSNPYLEEIYSFLTSDISLSQIVSIEKVAPTTQFVYDISVEGNENFVGGFGQILLHNSSEKLPPSINYREMLQSLAQIKRYAPLAKALLALAILKPNEGKNIDPAHEAIHTTVEVPNLEKLRTQERNIYDLVARRILATFAGEAMRESMQVKMNIGKHLFSTTGRRTLERGWMQYYGPYAKAEEIILPDLKKGDTAKVSKVEMLSKETSPPPRYSQAAMIKELDKRNLGTRATRASILQTLYDRHYVSDKSIKVTDLGMAVASTLKKYVPDLVDEKLTRSFEKDIEKIYEGKAKKEKIYGEAKKALTKISNEFKEHEEKIGKELGKAIIITQEDRSTLGPCKVCGGNLKALFSIFTKKSFAGCSNYSRCKICGFSKKACKCKCKICGGEKGKCKDAWKEKVWVPTCSVGFPLPGQGTYQRLDKICDKCGTPMIRVIRLGKRPFNMCLDPKCETKKDWNKPGEKKKFKKTKATKKTSKKSSAG